MQPDKPGPDLEREKARLHGGIFGCKRSQLLLRHGGFRDHDAARLCVEERASHDKLSLLQQFCKVSHVESQTFLLERRNAFFPGRTWRVDDYELSWFHRWRLGETLDNAQVPIH